MKTILDLNNKQARRFFMESENYCNIELPPYFDFTSMLNYVKSVCCNVKTLNEILSKNAKGKKIKPSQFDDINYTILANKDGRYAFRPFLIINPYNYYFLVKTITEKQNWAELMRLFNVTHKVLNVEVASIPKVKDYTKEYPRRKYDIDGYIDLFEQRSVALSLDYKYIFVTDITNCYGTIYTHSIAWAVNGKNVAKANRSNDENLGNKIDSQIQWMQYNQTNGIPQGSTLFDFIAEIVLGYADKRLADELNNQQIKEYKILRYRDDYKIFSKDKRELEIISFTLQKILAELNLTLNSGKTKISEDLVTHAYKEDKLASIESVPIYYHNKPLFTTVQKELLYIRSFALQHPNSGQSQKMLTALLNRISKQNKKNNDLEGHEHWDSIIAILVDISIGNPKLYGNVVALLSVALSNIETKEEQVSLVHKIYDKLCFLPNKGILQLWLQRITIPLFEETIKYEEKLCEIVANTPNATLWNISWIDEKYTNISLYNIVNHDILEKLKPIVRADEISPFEY